MVTKAVLFVGSDDKAQHDSAQISADSDYTEPIKGDLLF